MNKYVEKCVNRFRDLLGKHLKDNLYGLYLYNSVARDEFESKGSDIDFLVVLNEKDFDLNAMKKIHRLMRFTKYGKRLEGMYISKSDLGKLNIEDIYYVSHGRVKKGSYDINSVTWWSLKTTDYAIKSPSIVKDLDSISWSDVLNTIDYNINSYWGSKSYDLYSKMSWFEFGVCTMSRIIYSLEQGQITSKTKAMIYMKDMYPEYNDILDEALFIRKNGKRNKKALHAGEFMKEMIKRGQGILSGVKYSGFKS